ncbi:hypothetical protein D049_1031A, partial [Vibrio parahaemolyticus VPTS-2010]
MCLETDVELLQPVLGSARLGRCLFSIINNHNF